MRPRRIPDDVIESGERELFLAAEETPWWAVGHKARMALAHLVAEIGEDDELPTAGLLDISRDGDPKIQRKAATRSLGIIAFRALGSCRCLIACGYVPEAKAPIRRLTEAAIRAKAIADDRSGDHARAWLAGRPLGTPARLHRRFGTIGDSAGVFSSQAHAEADSLDDLFRFDGTEDVFVVAVPHRDEIADKLAELLIKSAVVQVLMLAYSLVETFDRRLSKETGDELNELCVLMEVRKTFNLASAPRSPGESSP